MRKACFAIMAFVLCALFLCAEVPVYAQNVNVRTIRSVGAVNKTVSECSITGTVTDSRGNKINNAYVTLKGMGKTIGGRTAVTSLTYKKEKVKNGYFCFSKLSPGRYKLILVEGETSSTQIQEVEVNDGENQKVEFSVQGLPKLPQN